MIELRNVKKIYTTKIGDVHALDGVNVTFPEKGLLFITGKSGSGKTTMLNIIGGLDGFDEGEIIVDGKSFSDLKAKDYDSYRNTFIGVVFQEYNLLPEYTVEKNIKIATELQGVTVDEEKIDNLMRLVGIEDFKKRLPSELSGGQMQRVAIARALIKNPHIILADEPTGALDSVTGIQVIETLKELSKQKLVIVVSHDLELAEKYADRIITLRDGQIISDDTIKEVSLEENIHQGKVLTVKAGAELTSQEKDIIVNAVKERKPIEVTEEITIREKHSTKKENIKVNENNNIKLIDSKMKFKSTAELGVKSLKVKPFRLIITILLSVIAFGLFGVFDSVASYDRQKILFYNLAESGFSSLVTDAEYIYENGDKNSVKISQGTIDEINQKTGYSFKGVSYINDIKDTSSNTSGQYRIEEIAAHDTKVRQSYYKKFVNGMLEFDDEKIVSENDGEEEVKYIRENGFNFKIIYGEYPRAFDKLGNLVNEQGLHSIGISKYLAESIVQYCGTNHSFGGVRLNTIYDLVGAKMQINGTKHAITCIIDCGDIPSRYDELKLSDKNTALQAELDSYLYSSANLLIFMDAGVSKYNIKKYNRTTSYFSTKAATSFSIDDVEGGIILTQQRAKWYAIDELDKNNYLTFATNEVKKDNKTTYENVAINENEVLINATKLMTVFGPEYERMREEHPEKKELLTLAKEISTPNTAVLRRREALNRFLEIIENYKPDPNIQGGHLGEKITSKNVTVSQKLDTSKEIITNEFKIAGVYFDIETNDPTPANWFFAVKKADLHKVYAYDGQGYFIRMISPIVQDANSRKAMAELLNKQTGLTVDWYNNTTISATEGNAEQVQIFFEIFIYVDIVLAFFAVFMLTNYVSTSIISKKQTIGILRALGSCGKDIFRIFIIESLVIAIFSGILATIFGFIGCSLVNFYIKEIMSINISFALFEIRQALIIFFSSVLTAILASLIPILRICKRKPVELIRKSN